MKISYFFNWLVLKGSLLEDVSLITVLNDLKKKSNESKAKISSAQDTEIKINAAREEYRPVATSGSILYFLLTDMGSVNSMYQTALHQFLKLFLESMTKYVVVYLPLYDCVWISLINCLDQKEYR